MQDQEQHKKHMTGLFAPKVKRKGKNCQTKHHQDEKKQSTAD